MQSPNISFELYWNRVTITLANYLFGAETDAGIIYDFDKGNKIYNRFITFLKYHMNETFRSTRYFYDNALLGSYVKNWQFFEHTIPKYCSLLKRLQVEWVNVYKNSSTQKIFDVETLCRVIGKSNFHDPLREKIEWTLKDLTFYVHVNTPMTMRLMKQAKEVKESLDNFNPCIYLEVKKKLRPELEVRPKKAPKLDQEFNCAVTPELSKPDLAKSWLQTWNANKFNNSGDLCAHNSASLEELAKKISHYFISTASDGSSDPEDADSPPPTMTNKTNKTLNSNF